MAYAVDPGGVFESDIHRRVLGHLPIPAQDPMDEETFLNRIAPDAGYEYAGRDEPLDVLADLEAAGYASNTKAGWKQTKKGLDALNAPLPEEG